MNQKKVFTIASARGILFIRSRQNCKTSVKKAISQLVNQLLLIVAN